MGHAEFTPPSSRLNRVLAVGQLERDKHQERLLSASTAATPSALAQAPVKTTASSMWDTWDLWNSTSAPLSSTGMPPLSNTHFRKPTNSVTGSLMPVDVKQKKKTQPVEPLLDGITGLNVTAAKVQDAAPTSEPVAAQTPLPVVSPQGPLTDAAVSVAPLDKPGCATETTVVYETTQVADFTPSTDGLHFSHNSMWHPMPEEGDLAVVLESSPNGLSDAAIACIGTKWLDENVCVNQLVVVHEDDERVWRAAE